MIIAIDGPAGAGKSTVAKLLAKKLDFLYVDTGAMYRALTLKALDSGRDIKNEEELIRLAQNSKIVMKNKQEGSIELYLDDKDVTASIREPRITQFVSDVAKLKGVREVMLKLQRQLALKQDAVLEGRDIGTVVFPNADIKFYLDADFNERMVRRYKELKESDSGITLKDVGEDISNRDELDSKRECAPLKKAEDAIYVDTTNLTISQVVETLLRYTKDRLPRQLNPQDG